jgi:glutamine phosphoribosylpyrophosphate amidotransferase
MCEILAVAWPDERSFATMHQQVCVLERLGLGGFGWGVAWLDAEGVQVQRGLGTFSAEAANDDRLMTTNSTRFLVHLRRPNRLSTIDLADTQPFFAATSYAFCHNGYLDRAERLRSRYADRLRGMADSEIGWLHFHDLVSEGMPPLDALRDVDATFAGKVNLGYLGDDGLLAVYAGNVANAMWAFELDDGHAVTTALHSDDDSVFRLVFPTGRRARLVGLGEIVTLDGAAATTAAVSAGPALADAGTPTLIRE